MKKQSFAQTLLKGITMTGIVLMSGKNLNFGLRNARRWSQEYEQKRWQQIYKSLYNLNHRGLVTFQLIGDEKWKVTITSKGKQIVKRLAIDDITLPRQEHWDGTWHIVIFDIPSTKHKNRNAFTQRLKNLGFKMMQKSVWAYPYKCHEEIMILRKFYGIEKYVMYIETKMVEDEPVWKYKFGL